MQIQLGIINDIPEIFNHIIPISHEGNTAIASDDMVENPYYYAFGWFVSQDGTNIMHGGGNPSFATFVDLFPNENIGVTVLSNSIDVNSFSIAIGIESILNSNLNVSYQMSMLRILDIVATILTVVGGLLTILFVFLGFRRKKFIAKSDFKERMVAISLLVLLTLVLFILTYTLPAILAGVSTWAIALNFVPFSLLTGAIAFPLSSSSILFLTLRENAK